MVKIRINELARELEVKPNVILDMLPELGVTEKKTHSSSIDEPVAIEVKRRLTEEPNGSPRPATAETESAPEHVEAGPSSEASRAPAAPRHEPLAEPPQPAAREAHTDAAAPPPPVPRSAPLRPPLASGNVSAHVPGHAASHVAERPMAPPVAPRGIPIPARPAPPAPRPGQILSGPRQPLPGPSPEARISHEAAPAALRPAAGPGVPSMPTPARPAPRPAAPPTATIVPGAPMGGGSPLRPPAKPNLAGQPAARPIVPPRPDLVAKLTRPPAPGAPRPGMPTRPASPVPGQPIYRGPIRPGQPMMRAPGQGPGGYAGGGAGGPGGLRGRGRPMHPTSPLRAEPAALPADPGRRHAIKPGSRDRRRDADPEEGRIRQVSRKQQAFEPPPIDREITIAEGVTVKELSEKLGIKGNIVVKRLFDKKIFATINQTLDVKLAEELARDFGASTNKVSYEEEATHEIQQAEIDEDRVRRAPVVTVMGHVDHGKTSLLDAIRLAHVADREAGGITQHIGAYRVEKNGRNIVFIDTPGHEAFTRMRARGAKVTDIVVLVVAADDGVMPQTLEAIDHAKAAKVPIVVAINKMDKGDAQPERIKQQLADRGLLAEDWGGDVVMVPVSARTKLNLDLLLEMILLSADLLDLKANPARPAMGNVLEAKLDRARGPVATVLVQNGTLRVGDYFICGSVFGKVRAMFDDHGEPVREAEPSTPVEVLGLDAVPEVGDTFQAVTDTAKAKQIVMYREVKAREVSMSRNTRLTLDQLHDQLKAGEVKDLNIILKTDVGGTAEVLSDTLQKLSNDKIKIRVLRAEVGAITESDVLLATTSAAIIIGFNVRPERNAQALAEQEKVDIRNHTIIYELVDEMKRAMTGLLDPVFKEVYKGRAIVREVFRISKVGAVAGCTVDDGVIGRNNEIRLLRDNKVVHTGKILSLKRFKNDASEVKAGFECGISIANYNDLKPGDVIEAFATERDDAAAVA